MSVNSSNPSSPYKENFESANPNYHDYFGSSDVDAEVSGLDSHFSLDIDNDELSSEIHHSTNISTGNSTDNIDDFRLVLKYQLDLERDQLLTTKNYFQSQLEVLSNDQKRYRSILGYTPDVSDYSSDSEDHLQPSKSNEAPNLSSPVYDTFQLSEDYANPMDYFDKNSPEIGQSSPVDYQSSSENYYSAIDSGSESDTGEVDPDQALQSLKALLSQYDNP
ncbi:hypothetical protein AYI70_g10717 [Smittium culicis]|uniref:Uncharacterized protein n=1 Tax=Smittium culicis TaxID=133412 RepID=A0A1R1X5F3_9FUNG|nr:hypothetical protein AYI70_g10717 [Smittium culicis]